MEQNAKSTERALRLRARMKQKKPNFVRPESWRYVRLKENWRRPRGLDHKVRLKYDGWPPGVEAGYRGPKAARGLHPCGLREVMVYNPEGLMGLDAESDVVRIGHTVGKRKRTMIIAEAKKKKIRVLNVKVAKEARAEAVEPSEEEESKEVEEKEEEKESEVVEEPEEPKEKQRKPGRRTKEKAQ
jgi:large subunit ribosomal protein L32e